ncbi:hypothetical protein [Staphylococcus equorum]|uniref:hypothetical protein n=1 Tax=Staphylococcus equorum TaxID=246432 RepID=UPI000E6A75DF|nr:hypothetical protein [Staphylococcus equorum]RIL38380.1 hypothetical protein BUY84_08815 [Staphylococcus equorum]
MKDILFILGDSINKIESLLEPYPRLTTILSMIITITIAYTGILRERKKMFYHSKFIENNIDLKMNKNHGGRYKHIELMNNQMNKIKDLVNDKSKDLITDKSGNFNENVFKKEYVNEVAFFMNYYLSYNIEDMLSNMIDDLEYEINKVEHIYLKQKSVKLYIDFINSSRNIKDMFYGNEHIRDYNNIYEDLFNQEYPYGFFNKMLLNKIYNNIDDLAKDFSEIFKYYKKCMK